MNDNYYTRGEKEFLLKIARTTLEKYLRDSERFEPQTVNQKLWEKRGVFVTLTKKDELRGCIGCLEPVESLILAVRDNATLAARDPRFLPLTAEELNGLKIEISILSEPEKCDFNQIKKGDGVILKQGRNSATYLPQVWDAFKKAPSPEKEFFGTLCQKAGLASDCFQDAQTEFFKYDAIVFKEDEI